MTVINSSRKIVLSLASVILPQLGFSTQNGSPLSSFASPRIGTILRSNTSEICTGTLIRGRLIITAAHCVAGASPQSIRFKVPSLDRTFDIETIRIHDAYVDSNTRPESEEDAQADIAILKIRNRMVDGETNYLEDKDDFELARSDAESGLHQFIGYSDNELLSRRNKLEQIALVQTGTGKSAADFMWLNSPSKNPFQSICEGDSGGALFQRVGGKQILTGIASGTFKKRRLIRRKSEGPCEKVDAQLFTSVAYHRQWIEHAIETLMPAPTLDLANDDQ